MKYCKDISLLIGDTYNGEPSQSAEVIQIYSPSFPSGHFLQWNAETQCFEEHLSSDKESSVPAAFFNEQSDATDSESTQKKDFTWRKTHWSYIYGALKILDKSYLIGITAVEHLTRTDIFRCDGLSWIALPATKTSSSSSAEKALLSHYHALLDEFCVHESRNLYGSFSHDISKKHGGDISTDTMGFQWNAELFRQFDSKKYIVPLIYGYVESYSISGIDFTLISRRSRLHVGTRYHTRGINKDGFAAATVETEIIITNTRNDITASCVFHRGSFPVFWAQPLTGRFSPAAHPTTEKHGSKVTDACRAHFERLHAYYGGRVTVLNLLSEKNISSVQKVLREQVRPDEAFGQTISSVVNFNFHKYCSLMKFGQTIKLIDRIRDEIDEKGYSLIITDGVSQAYQQTQSGVIRFNCVDCIDRTNFAQFLVCQYIVRKVLDEIEPNWSFSVDFLSGMWKRNGGALALQYLGTNALYQDAYLDFHRPLQSAAYDGFQALKRYFENHFTDGRKQDRLNIATRPNYIDSFAYSTEMYDVGGDLHLLLAGGIFFSFFLAWGNWYFGAAFVGDAQSDSAFFSKMFSGVWGGVSCLLILSSVLLRKKLFSYPHSAPGL